jgi:hypothetical protein
MQRCINKAGSVAELSRQIGLSKSTLFNYNSEIGLEIGNLKKILDFLEINYDRINPKIQKISWNQTFLDLDFNSSEMAIILAASLADGHINKTHFMYKNKNPELIDRVELFAKKVFGDKILVSHKIDKNGTNYILLPSFVKRQLEYLGSPSGKKLFVNPHVPEIILNGTFEQKKCFIQQFFDDEGWPQSEGIFVACAQSSDTTNIFPESFINSIPFRKYIPLRNISLEFRSRIIKPNLLVDIKNILEKDFGMFPSLKLKNISKYNFKDRVYVSARWQLELNKKSDAQKFFKEIQFFSSKKQEILSQILIEKEVPKDFVYRTIKYALFKKKMGLTFKVSDLQKEMNINKGKIRKRLSNMVKDKILLNDSGDYSFNFEV